MAKKLFNKYLFKNYKKNEWEKYFRNQRFWKSGRVLMHSIRECKQICELDNRDYLPKISNF